MDTGTDIATKDVLGTAEAWRREGHRGRDLGIGAAAGR